MSCRIKRRKFVAKQIRWINAIWCSIKNKPLWNGVLRWESLPGSVIPGLQNTGSKNVGRVCPNQGFMYRTISWGSFNLGFSEDAKAARGEPPSPCSRVELTSSCLSLDDFFEREPVTEASLEGIYLGDQVQGTGVGCWEGTRHVQIWAQVLFWELFWELGCILWISSHSFNHLPIYSLLFRLIPFLFLWKTIFGNIPVHSSLQT